MPKWTEYTSKDTLADNDEVMLYDATARANKRGLMSKFWDYVVDKMSTAVIGKLETENKTIIGALNKLNSDSFINVDISNGKKYNLDNYKSGLYCFIGADTGINTGTSLPDGSVSIVSQIGNIQIAASMIQSYYIRYYWGTWKEWRKIS